MTGTVCVCVSMLVYVCVMHFQELNNRTLLAARRGHEMSLKMLKFIFGRGPSPRWAPQRGVAPEPHWGLSGPCSPACFQWVFFLKQFPCLVCLSVCLSVCVHVFVRTSVRTFVRLLCIFMERGNVRKRSSLWCYAPF